MFTVFTFFYGFAPPLLASSWSFSPFLFALSSPFNVIRRRSTRERPLLCFVGRRSLSVVLGRPRSSSVVLGRRRSSPVVVTGRRRSSSPVVAGRRHRSSSASSSSSSSSSSSLLFVVAVSLLRRRGTDSLTSRHGATANSVRRRTDIANCWLWILANDRLLALLYIPRSRNTRKLRLLKERGSKRVVIQM